MRVLVAEKIGASGVELLKQHFEVDEGAEHLERIADYDGLIIRSATQVTADLIEQATHLKAIGRAGVVTAAEHTLALLLALARNVPQAHASLVAGRWDRSKYSGVELLDKTLGILGFGRIGQLVAQRAHGFGMRVVAYDPYVGEERYRDLGVEKAETSEDVYAQADFITVHLPKTPETENWLNADAFAKMKDGVRILNVARGPLIDDAALKAALDSGKVAGAALDVFRSEPITEHPLFGYPNVVVTPHLGASTAEATDRAGFQAAEQVIAALTGGSVTTAVNVQAVAAEDLEVLGPFLPLCQALGRIGVAAAGGLGTIEVEFLGRIAERDTRPLVLAVLLGALHGHTEDEVNAVNAPSIAAERGIEIVESKRTTARDFSDLVRVTIDGTRVVGTLLGRRDRPHLLEAWGQRFNLQLQDHLAFFRYRDQPGMIGRVGTCFGQHGINIDSAAVGHDPEGDSGTAVMVVTTDAPVPQEIVDEIAGADGFIRGTAVSLA
jgi:D-3-phosphoglycerate dehydrogenase